MTNKLNLRKARGILIIGLLTICSAYIDVSIEQYTSLLKTEPIELGCFPVFDTCIDVDQEETELNYFEMKPYKNAYEAIDYFYTALESFEQRYNIPWEIIIAKMWLETEAGHKGAGRRGALFGIKGKGVKGYDNVDKESVEYQGYKNRWEAISHFCQLLRKPLYYNRYIAWKAKDFPDWKAWAYALQVHPDINKSKYAYAACGCKDGTNKQCYNTRMKHAKKCEKFIMKYIYKYSEKDAHRDLLIVQNY